MDSINGNISTHGAYLGEDSVIVSKAKWNEIQKIVDQRDKWMETNSHQVIFYTKNKNFTYSYHDFHLRQLDTIWISNPTPEVVREELGKVTEIMTNQMTVTESFVKDTLDEVKKSYNERLSRIPKWVRWLFKINGL